MMKAYPENKKSNVPWIGEIPVDWDIKPFYTIAEESKVSNVGMKSDNLLSLSYGNIIRKNIETATGLLPESFETYQVIKKDYLIFRLTDLQNDKRSLRSAIVKEDGIITSAYVAVIPKKIRPRFFHYLMRSYDTTKVFYNLGSGMRQSLKYSGLKKLPVVLPPIEVQKAIENYLDKNVKRIDNLISEKENFIKLLSEKRQALIHEVIYDQKTELIRLRYCADKVSRGITREDESEYEPVGVYNRARGIFSKGSTLGKDLGDSDFGYIKEGDLLISGQFAWEGSVSIVTSEFDGCVVSHRYHIYRGKEGVVDNDYLWAYLTTSQGDFILNECSRGSAGRNRPLNSRLLELEKIPVPPIKSQLKIKKMVEAERKIKAELKAFKSYLEEHRLALISAAVTGKIDVREEM